MIELSQLTVPTEGERIGFTDGQLVVPNKPIIPVIEGDGIGRDIMKTTRRVVDTASRPHTRRKTDRLVRCLRRRERHGKIQRMAATRYL